MDSDFYTEFENNFRGSREQIMDVLSNYDGLIDYILNIDFLQNMMILIIIFGHLLLMSEHIKILI